ncbi:hypothetical protein TWF694_002210 [Orbilia ellipsospora]|uniref:TIGR02453 family protein n=1 Tax=Orbilia ellipsospora TaxID=2528407 RepID=A0AAV9X1H4_9PEZI
MATRKGRKRSEPATAASLTDISDGSRKTHRRTRSQDVKSASKRRAASNENDGCNSEIPGSDSGDTEEENEEEEEVIDERLYADNTLHPETLRFLRELAQNNEREWFHANKEIYKVALADFKSFSTVLQEEITKVDWTVPVLPLERHNLFRIHRDIRFSSSKVPYKEYFAVAFSRTGKQGLYAKYYLSIQPGNHSFIGGGLWHPEATHVSLVRRAIDRNPQELKDILTSKDFYANFLNSGETLGYRKTTSKKSIEERALKNFIERNSEDALKTAPKGYDKDHPDIELLRLKSYTIGKRITDDEILLPNSLDFLVDIIRVMEPFVRYSFERIYIHVA